MSIRAFLAAGVLALVGCASDPARAINDRAPAGTGMLRRELTLADGTTHRYSVFVPYAYDAARAWPTIVFLHGLGEGGRDGAKSTTVGLGPAIGARAATFDHVAIFPQSGGRWSTDDAGRIAIGALDAVQAAYNVDRSRVYLTGLSTGGYGTWAIGARHRERFAALVPICAYSGEKHAERLVGLPIWSFHNAGDPFVPASSTRATVAKINALGGDARQTIYGGVGHDCWTRAYADPALWAWLARQHK